MLLVAQRILNRQNPAPGVTEQEKIAAIESQGLAHLLHLIHKTLDLPEISVIGLAAVMRTQLIVEIELDSRLGQKTVQHLEILVGAARPAMEQQQLDVRTRTAATCPNIKRAVSSPNRNLANTGSGRSWMGCHRQGR